MLCGERNPQLLSPAEPVSPTIGRRNAAIAPPRCTLGDVHSNSSEDPPAVAVAEGNPLALLELPTALSGPQRVALENLPAVLPLSQRLQALFVPRVSSLPPAARQAGFNADLEDLAAAEKDQLVNVDHGARRLVLRHPLIRSAVVSACTGAERRAAHRALAEALENQPERRAWRLGEASVEPDEQVAALLEQAAHRITARGDAVGAVAALVRAADLSPHGSDRARRLANDRPTTFASTRHELVVRSR
jgi:hypothetical protein